ncbi:hypothetical protein AIGOOFII_1364 [Methylobacterium marchantiae]|nr:hypothetical protein AIGOOFII_1364 [Methylobacterium marchantiae]
MIDRAVRPDMVFPMGGLQIIRCSASRAIRVSSSVWKGCIEYAFSFPATRRVSRYFASSIMLATHVIAPAAHLSNGRNTKLSEPIGSEAAVTFFGAEASGGYAPRQHSQ